MDFLIAHPQLFWFPHVVLSLFVLGQFGVIGLYGARNPLEPLWPHFILMPIIMVLPLHGLFPFPMRLPVSDAQRTWADVLAMMAVVSIAAMPLIRWCVLRSLRRAANAAAIRADRDMN